MAATGPEGTAWSCVRGGAAGGEGKGLHQRAVGMEQPAQGSGHGPKLPELRERLDTALRHWVWILGGPVWRRELGLMIRVGPSHLGMFCFSISTLTLSEDVIKGSGVT